MSDSGVPAVDPLIGQVVDGRYQIVRMLGRGGMGVVYEAAATRLGRRPCAVKVLRPEFTSQDHAAARFSREAELAARVKHLNVVEIFDTGTTADGRGYIAMEMLRGESLERTLRREGKLPWQRVRHMLLQICRALGAAHAQKIVHRDMKPENCFRSADTEGDADCIKVLDFGIAKLTDGQTEGVERLTASNAIIGTYAYMAPEQVRGEEIDPRVDIWAVGVMAYEMLTGGLPFRGNNQGQIWTAICYYDPQPMRHIAPGAAIPEPVEAIVGRALARDRDDRFSTIAEMARAIAEVPAGSELLGADALGPLTPPPERDVAGNLADRAPAPQRRGSDMSAVDPVTGHGLTELSDDEVIDTGEQPARSGSLRMGLEVSDDEPRDATPPPYSLASPAPPPALGTVLPATSQGRRRAVWALAALGLLGIVAILLIARLPPSAGADPGIGVSPQTSAAMATASSAPAAPTTLVPAPEPTTTPIPTPTIDPPPAPDSAPEPLLDGPSTPVSQLATRPPMPATKSVAKPTKRPGEPYAVRAQKAHDALRDRDRQATCFKNDQPLKVDVDIDAIDGTARLTISPLQAHIASSVCVQRVFGETNFPAGGPGDTNFISKGYVLNGR